MCQTPGDNRAGICRRSPIPSLYDVIWFTIPGSKRALGGKSYEVFRDTPRRQQVIASPSIKHDRTGSAATAAAINGKREEKSFPAWVIRRTPALSRRARMRK